MTETANDIVIAARDLTKRYGDVDVVDHINFDIAKGETFGLLGPNGAGKTTTILMMLGLTEISGGSIRVLGDDPARAPLQVKRRVGYLPDSVGFYDHLTAVENLAYTSKLMGLRPAELTPQYSRSGSVSSVTAKNESPASKPAGGNWSTARSNSAST